jgi:hypothetical protein
MVTPTTVHVDYLLSPNSWLTAAQLAAQMDAAALPIPAKVLSYLAMIGLGVTSDSTANGPPVDRTIVCTFAPTTPAAATIGRVAGDESGAPLDPATLVLSNKGLLYFAPPVVQAVPAAGDTPLKAAQLRSFLEVNSTVNITNNGDGHYVEASVKFVGGLRLDGLGVEATATAAVSGDGHIASITLTSPGKGYVSVPAVVITDPTGGGSGATATCSMQVGEIDVMDPGAGYAKTPTLVITDLFEFLFPNFADQERAVTNLIYRLMVQQMGPLLETVSLH